ncbi:hypothetical protein CBR_g9151 [Chara braunii]|uniref:Uncharacterized protein n=1 Tax=Chara braunii TaxID=69332 RepID=A0A388KNX2_CHABU|nr:hypothetical protein CBR_g9151 [Chara braunii]|eukprot:GBG71742.1 hypothetical protein CBR_g9151 [Chara braunii]
MENQCGYEYQRHPKSVKRDVLDCSSPMVMSGPGSGRARAELGSIVIRMVNIGLRQSITKRIDETVEGRSGDENDNPGARSDQGGVAGGDQKPQNVVDLGYKRAKRNTKARVRRVLPAPESGSFLMEELGLLKRARKKRNKRIGMPIDGDVNATSGDGYHEAKDSLLLDGAQQVGNWRGVLENAERRKLARLMRLQQLMQEEEWESRAEGWEKGEERGQKMGLGSNKGRGHLEDDRDLREQMLKDIEHARFRRKRELILLQLRQNIANRKIIHPSYGELVFFEHEFR